MNGLYLVEKQQSQSHQKGEASMEERKGQKLPGIQFDQILSFKQMLELLQHRPTRKFMLYVYGEAKAGNVVT